MYHQKLILYVHCYHCLPSETEYIALKHKLKLCYKGHYMYKYIRPDKVINAIKWLKTNNPLYADIIINDGWLNDSVANNNESFHSISKQLKSEVNTITSHTEQMEGIVAIGDTMVWCHFV